MSDFHIALLIFFGLVIIGIILVVTWSDTLETIFTLLGFVAEIIWNLFLLVLCSGFLIFIITFMVHIYRMDW